MCNNFIMFFEFFHWSFDIFVIEPYPHNPAGYRWHISRQFRVFPDFIIPRGKTIRFCCSYQFCPQISSFKASNIKTNFTKSCSFV